MQFERDYKADVILSLHVMQEARNKICKDSKEHYSVIYSGLHESESDNTRELYFQAYEMEWLDSHWDILTVFLNQCKEKYNKSVQKDITLFFAEYFSKYMSEIDNASPLAKGTARELIVAQKKVIEQMLMFADRWEERSNQLKVNLKKHKEHFRRLIESMHNSN